MIPLTAPVQVVIQTQVAFPPPPSAQKMQDSVNMRPIFAPIERLAGNSHLLHHAFAHPKRECMNTCLGLALPVTCRCLPAVNKEERKNFYIQVYENKIEYNEPVTFCFGMNCEVFDNTKVIHLDREVMQQAAKAENCCQPACSHSSMFPGCCGMWGETLVLYKPVPCCCGQSSGCCTCCTVYNRRTIHQFRLGANPNSILIEGVDDAEAVANAINQAKSIRQQTGTFGSIGAY